MNIESLKSEIKSLIIEALNLQDIDPKKIKDDMSLFEPNDILELDSVDALEIVMALQRKYGIRLEDQKTSRNVLKSINTIADFVMLNINKKQ